MHVPGLFDLLEHPGAVVGDGEPRSGAIRQADASANRPHLSASTDPRSAGSCARMAVMQQLDLFPDDIRIERVDPQANMYRFYRMRLLPDLFGGVSLLREWGRIGTQGRHRIELFADAGQAVDAMLAVCRSKQKRGYRIAT